jgi:hypothetical protein
MEGVARKRFGAKEMAASEAVQLVGRVGILGRYITKIEIPVDSLGSEYLQSYTTMHFLLLVARCTDIQKYFVGIAFRYFNFYHV